MDEKEMSHFQKFVTEGNEKADALAKEGAMLDEGFMAEARAKTVQQEREEMYAALQYAASFFIVWQRNGRIVKSSSQSQKEGEFLWLRKEKKLSIGRSGVGKFGKMEGKRLGAMIW